ncbi:multidrug resistance efflux transporter family protein [Psychrobacter piscatorii]|uniref:multidrug resistance efflux transporter family protein n=1 Tax=Psychrobacter piscatorii TaxID=554343 RepID=UPI001917B143|nr:multidrug resistance efflux transporter family protein [Psychrobacter piscatorii]
MIRLILLGLLSGAFFSSTFVLNELMSAAGGHWFWSASLRYVFMLLLLTAMIGVQHGVGRIGELWAIFRQHIGFWCITGSIGFGMFYTGICYAGDHASGWVVAATFMFTVVTSLLVLLAFGQRFDKKFIVYALIVFVGVVLVNVSEGLYAPSDANTIPLTQMLLYGALPALIAAFSYPIGNQLVWQASYNAKQHKAKLQDSEHHSQPMRAETALLASAHDAVDIHSADRDTANSSTLQTLIGRIPVIETDLLQNAFNKVWLMTVGSFPFWIVLGLVVRPELPGSGQVFNTLLVALLSGVAATSLFLYAREQAVTSSEVAGVDSTQASEIIFALIGGMILLGNPLPSAMGLIGIVLIIIGLILFAKDG